MSGQRLSSDNPCKTGSNIIKDLCEEMTIPSGVKEEIDEGPENDPARIWLKSDGKKWVRDSGPINPVISA